MRRNRAARMVIAIFAVAFAVGVAFNFKRRPAARPVVSVERTDPNAVLETTGGRVMRFNRAHEDVTVEYAKQLTYADGSTRLLGVKVLTERGGRTFTITGNEGQLGKNESEVTLSGAVHLAASDGFTAKTEHATYTDKDSIVRAAGPVEFAHERMTGSGVGLTYDKNQDVLTILDQAVVRVAGEKGGGAADVTSGVATFMRRDKTIRFDRMVKVQRSGQVMDAETGVAYLTPDEKHVQTLELHGNARITGPSGAANGLQSLTGHDVTLRYRPEEESLEHALVSGDAAIQLAGDQAVSGPQIEGSTIDVGFAPDGTTPVTLAARDHVTLVFPSDRGSVRSVRAATLDSRGTPDRGLTEAQLTGSVEYKEKSATVDRLARSGRLDVSMKPGMRDVEEARFADNVRFADTKMSGTAAAIRYGLEQGVLQLSGREPASPVPRVFNNQIAVDAAAIEVTLAGPLVKATGQVKSVLQPPKKDEEKADTKMPSMLKQDQPVNVTADELMYDGSASKATYTGRAQLWQGDTSIRGDTLTIDDKQGDVDASGSVATSIMLEQVNKDKRKERVRSIATAKEFQYDDAARRATYTGDAHVVGSQGDMTAAKVELYLRPLENELDRAEAYDEVTLREQNRKTTGSRMTYTAADERYVITGTPVAIVDECGRETTGRTLTFLNATDTIDVDGNGYRTQTKGGGKCS